MIKRAVFDRSIYLLKHFPALVLLGSRQVGKTTLARQLQKSLKKESIYFDLENDRDLYRFELDAQSILEDNTDKLVIIDEVQRFPRLFALLRSIIDQKKAPGRFLLLGSASPDMIRGVTESLAGRVSYLDIYPLSFLELKSKRISMRKHWLRGGYPDAVLASDDEIAFQWLDDYIKSYIERDLSKIFQQQINTTVVRNFWSMLASSNGDIFNAESYARALGITGPTINKYLDLLQGAYLVNRLQPWFTNVKKRVIKSPKIYITDTGLLHRLNFIDSWDELQRNKLIGASWESYVVQQVIANLPKDYSAFYYRTQNGAEADLLLAKGNDPVILCEIKYSQNPNISRGFYSCMEDLGTQNNVVITPGNGDFMDTQKNIRFMGLSVFIEKQLLLLQNKKSYTNKK